MPFDYFIIKMMEYPVIVLEIVAIAKNTLYPGFLIDADWVCLRLYYYQSSDYFPLSESDQDVVFLAEEIAPRADWGITQEHFEFAKKNYIHSIFNPLYSNGKSKNISNRS